MMNCRDGLTLRSGGAASIARCASKIEMIKVKIAGRFMFLENE